MASIYSIINNKIHAHNIVYYYINRLPSRRQRGIKHPNQKNPLVASHAELNPERLTKYLQILAYRGVNNERLDFKAKIQAERDRLYFGLRGSDGLFTLPWEGRLVPLCRAQPHVLCNGNGRQTPRGG
ncbi:MAG: hypothetical protein ABIP67_08405 [Burkholderiales bacterium]